MRAPTTLGGEAGARQKNLSKADAKPARASAEATRGLSQLAAPHLLERAPWVRLGPPGSTSAGGTRRCADLR